MLEQTIKTLIIGVGNRYRHDDAVGLIIASRLCAKLSDDCEIIAHSGEGAALMEMLKDKNSVIIIDAVSSGATVGTIHRLNANAQKIPTNFFNYSTHAFSLAEAIEMARVLHQLPERLLIYGIEGENFTMGEGLSSAVERAAREVESEILRLAQQAQLIKSV
ncbi:MAG: hydrogenase maturation protease [Acidobacteriota bacterium]